MAESDDRRAGSPNGSGPREAHVAIVGAGFSGLGMAIRLKQAGREDFVVLERAHDVGGTWRENVYPGIACDVPSHLYSFSFVPNPRWSRTYSPGDEIWEYLRDCAERYGVAPHIRYGHEVTAADWDEERRRWRLETPHGSISAEVLVTGAGALSVPSTPQIDGLERFEGKVFHSSAWDPDHDLTGRRVAVIGTGASAIQFVPRIQPRVGRLHLFQRTPPWVFPRTDRAITRLERRLYARFPALQRLVRAAVYCNFESRALPMAFDPRLMKPYELIARLHLRRQVRNPELRAKLQPSYMMGCKRILISNDYYPALTQPNVEVVTDPVRAVGPSSVITADGAEREVDTIILGTGFRVSDWPAVGFARGRGGARLADVWRERGAEAFLGTTVAGFPNMFILLGPGTGLGHNSVVYMIESQIAYVMDCLRLMRERDLGVVEVTPEAQAAYDGELQARMRGTVWASGCASWYLHPSGRNPTLWAGFTWRFRQRTRRFDPGPYRIEARATLERAAWRGDRAA